MYIEGVQRRTIAILRYITSRQQYENNLIIWKKGGVLEKEISICKFYRKAVEQFQYMWKTIRYSDLLCKYIFISIKNKIYRLP